MTVSQALDWAMVYPSAFPKYLDECLYKYPLAMRYCLKLNSRFLHSESGFDQPELFVGL